VAAECAAELDACMADPDCDQAVACVATQPGWIYGCEVSVAALRRESFYDPRAFIERHGRTFAGSGVGWADAQIVLSAARSGARVHTSDRDLKRVCKTIGIIVA
jgi:hypothetical protein